MNIIKKVASVFVAAAVVLTNPIIAFALNEVVDGMSQTTLDSIHSDTYSMTGSWDSIPYEYTGNVHTGQVSLYDYKSDSELEGNGFNSTVSGYTDPFTQFNSYISNYQSSQMIVSHSEDNLTICYNDLNAYSDSNINPEDKDIKVCLSNYRTNTDWNAGQMTYDPIRSSVYHSNIYTFTVAYDDLGFEPMNFIIHGTDMLGEWQTNEISCDLIKGQTWGYCPYLVMADFADDDNESNDNDVAIRVNGNTLRAISLNGQNVSSRDFYLSWTNAKPIRVHVWDEGGSGTEQNVVMTVDPSNENHETFFTATLDLSDYTGTPMLVFQSKYYSSAGSSFSTDDYIVWSDAYVIDKGYSFLFDGINDAVLPLENSADDLWGDRTPYYAPLYFGSFYKGDNASDYTETNVPDYLKFYWQSNMSHQMTANASVQGLVDTDLIFGLPSQKGEYLPYFDRTFANSTPMVTCYEGLSFPFYEVEANASDILNNNSVEGKAKFYQFNSRDTNVYYDKDNNVIKESAQAIHSQGGNAGFFPFDKDDDGTLNLGFGSRFDVRFKLNSSGTTALYDDHGNPTGEFINSVFEFSGDDDVWVFVDDRLVLDMGGIHSNAKGIIDFGSKSATVYDAYSFDENDPYNLNPNVNDAIVDLTQRVPSMFISNGTDLTYNESQEHTLTVFFLERGMYDSNLFMRFNTIPAENQNTFEIEEVTDFSYVNPGFLEETINAANRDVFMYEIKNSSEQNGSANDIVNPVSDTYVRNPNTESEMIVSGNNKPKMLYVTTPSDVQFYSYLYVWAFRQDADGAHDGKLYSFDIDNIENTEYSTIITNNANRIVFVSAYYCNDVNTFPDEDLMRAHTPTGDGAYSFDDGDIFTITSSEFTEATKLANVYDGDGLYTSNGSGANQCVKNVKYLWEDPRIIRTQTVDGEALSGRTDPYGCFPLFSGYDGHKSSAKFISQFQSGSNMCVTQRADLRAITSSDGMNIMSHFLYDNHGMSSYRRTSDYYQENVSLVDAYGNHSLNVSSGSLFTYSNLSGLQNNETPVRLKETFSNVVRTGSIQVTNQIVIEKLSGYDNVERIIERNNADREFKFRIYIGNIFGYSGTQVTDYESIVANRPIVTCTREHTTDLNEGEEPWTEVWGEFTLKNEEDLVITGVPMGTCFSVYVVTSADDPSYYIDDIYGHFDTSSGFWHQEMSFKKDKQIMSGKVISLNSDVIDSTSDKPSRITASSQIGDASPLFMKKSLGVTTITAPFSCSSNESRGIVNSVSKSKSASIINTYGPSASVSLSVLMENESWRGEYNYNLLYDTSNMQVVIYNVHDVGSISVQKHVEDSGASVSIGDSTLFEFSIDMHLLEGDMTQYDILCNNIPLNECAASYNSQATDPLDGYNVPLDVRDTDEHLHTIKDLVWTEDHCSFKFVTCADDISPDGFTITNVPFGTSYTITEHYEPDPYSPDYYDISGNTIPPFIPKWWNSRCYITNDEDKVQTGILLHDRNGTMSSRTQVVTSFYNEYAEVGFIAIGNTINKSDNGDFLTNIESTTYTPINGYDPTFTFDITILDCDDKPVNSTYPYYIEDNQGSDPVFGTITITDGQGSFDLKDGQYIVIDEIPCGYMCDVVERATSVYYVKNVVVPGLVPDPDADEMTFVDDYVINDYNYMPPHSAYESQYQEQLAENVAFDSITDYDLFVFHDELNFQTVTVNKVVQDDSLNGEYAFDVDLSTLPLQGTFNNAMTIYRSESNSSTASNIDITGSTKTISASLNPDDSIILVLPIGTSYKVTEAGGAGYTAKYMTNNGEANSVNTENTSLSTLVRTIVSAQDDIVTFTNRPFIAFEPYVLPATGFSDRRMLMLLLFFGMIFSTAAYRYTTRRKRNE